MASTRGNQSRQPGSDRLDQDEQRGRATQPGEQQREVEQERPQADKSRDEQRAPRDDMSSEQGDGTA